METAQLRSLRARLDALTKQIEELEGMPPDDYGPGDVIVWERTFPGSARAFSFAALRLEDTEARPWVVTGARLGGLKTWEQVWSMLKNADEGTSFWASEWEPL